MLSVSKSKSPLLRRKSYRMKSRKIFRFVPDNIRKFSAKSCFLAKQKKKKSLRQDKREKSRINLGYNERAEANKHFW